MKTLLAIAWIAAGLGLLAAAISYPVESSYASRAKLVQRVRTDAADALFGGEATPVGSPQKLIIDDPKAFTGKKSAGGAALVDEAYLEKNGIYPLQLQTVSYVAGLVRLAGASVGVVGVLAAIVVGRRARSRRLAVA